MEQKANVVEQEASMPLHENNGPEAVKQFAGKVQLYEAQNNKEQTIFGLSVRTWTLIVLISVAVTVGIFIIAPFVISLIVQLIPGYDIGQLVDVIDGVALVVGITGTAASIASIVMTLADKRRYNQEKNQMRELFLSVTRLQQEVETVERIANNTLLQNTQMGEALFAGKMVPFNPNMVNMSSSIKVDATAQWKDKNCADELSPSMQSTNAVVPPDSGTETVPNEPPA